MNSDWIPSHVQLTVHQGRELLLKSKSGSSEVFVCVQLEKEKHYSRYLSPHTAPLWNYSIDIPLMSLDTTLRISVRQKGRLGSEEFIGCFQLNLGDFLVTTKPVCRWYTLGPRPGKTSTKIRGDLLVTTKFVSKWNPLTVEGDHFNEGGSLSIANGGTQQKSKLRRSNSERRSWSQRDFLIDRHTLDRPQGKERTGIFRRSFRRKHISAVTEKCDDDFESLSVLALSQPQPLPDVGKHSSTIDSHPSPRFHRMATSPGVKGQSDSEQSECSPASIRRPSARDLFAEVAALEDDGDKEGGAEGNKIAPAVMKFQSFRKKRRPWSMHQLLPTTPSWADASSLKTEGADTSPESQHTADGTAEQVSRDDTTLKFSSEESMTEKSLDSVSSSRRVPLSRARSSSLSLSRERQVHSLANRNSMTDSSSSMSDSLTTSTHRGSPILSSLSQEGLREDYRHLSDTPRSRKSIEYRREKAYSFCEGRSSAHREEEGKEFDRHAYAELQSSSFDGVAVEKRTVSPLHMNGAGNYRGRPKVLNFNSGVSGQRSLSPRTHARLPPPAAVTSSHTHATLSGVNFTTVSDTNSTDGDEGKTHTLMPLSSDSNTSRPATSPQSASRSQAKVNGPSQGHNTLAESARRPGSGHLSTPTRLLTPIRPAPLPVKAHHHPHSMPARFHTPHSGVGPQEQKVGELERGSLSPSSSTPSTKQAAASSDLSRALSESNPSLSPSSSSSFVSLSDSLGSPSSRKTKHTVVYKDSSPLSNKAAYQPAPLLPPCLSNSKSQTQTFPSQSQTLPTRGGKIQQQQQDHCQQNHTPPPLQETQPGNPAAQTLPQSDGCSSVHGVKRRQTVHRTPENTRLLHRRSLNVPLSRSPTTTPTLHSSSSVSQLFLPASNEVDSLHASQSGAKTTPPSRLSSSGQSPASSRSSTPVTPATGEGKMRPVEFSAFQNRPRRSPGGLKRALSLYQENRRQVERARRDRGQAGIREDLEGCDGTGAQGAGRGDEKGRVLSPEEVERMSISAGNSPKHQRQFSPFSALQWSSPFASLCRTLSNHTSLAASTPKTTPTDHELESPRRPTSALADPIPRHCPSTPHPDSSVTVETASQADSSRLHCNKTPLAYDRAPQSGKEKARKDSPSELRGGMPASVNHERWTAGKDDEVLSSSRQTDALPSCKAVSGEVVPADTESLKTLTDSDGRRESGSPHPVGASRHTCSSLESEGFSSMASDEFSEEQDWSLWSKEDLIKEMLHSRQKLHSVEDEMKAIKSYLDNLLLRIMETNPTLLSTTS